MLVEAFQKLFKLGFLFRREDRADIVTSFLMHLVELRIGLIVNRLCLGMLLQQDGVDLLNLVARQVQQLRELLHTLSAPRWFRHGSASGRHQVMRIGIA